MSLAIKGRCVGLEEFLKNAASYFDNNNLCDLKTFVLPDGSVQYKQKSNRRHINSYLAFLEAFNNYEELMNSVFGIKVYKPLKDYREFIGQCDKKYPWNAIAKYDIRHPMKLWRLVAWHLIPLILNCP